MTPNLVALMGVVAIIGGFVAVILALLWKKPDKFQKIVLIIVGAVALLSGLLAIKFLLPKTDINQQMKKVDYVDITPSQMRHNYKKQDFRIYNGDFEAGKSYRVKIGKKIDIPVSAATAARTNENGEIVQGNDGQPIEEVTLFGQLPDDKNKKLKPGKIYDVLISTGRIIAKAKIEVLADPMAPPTALVWGDKLFALGIFLVVVLVIVAIVGSVHKGIRTKKEAEQQAQQQTGATP